MNAGWIDALALVETAEARQFVRILEDHVSGADATYRSEEHLCVVPDTDEDEVMLRLMLPDWHTICGIRQIGERGYLLPPRLMEDVYHWLNEGLFQGGVAALTVVGLELRDGAVLRRLGAALDAERVSFIGQPPQLGRA
jgi:hypothetical protein